MIPSTAISCRLECSSEVLFSVHVTAVEHIHWGRGNPEPGTEGVARRSQPCTLVSFIFPQVLKHLISHGMTALSINNLILFIHVQSQPALHSKYCTVYSYYEACDRL